MARKVSRFYRFFWESVQHRPTKRTRYKTRARVRVLFAKLQNAKLRFVTPSPRINSTFLNIGSHRVHRLNLKMRMDKTPFYNAQKPQADGGQAPPPLKMMFDSTPLFYSVKKPQVNGCQWFAVRTKNPT